MCATAPTRRSTGWSTICCGRACRSASIRRRWTSRPFQPTGDLVSVPAVPIPGRPEYRTPARAYRARSAATSPNSSPTSSTSPAPTSSAIARSAGRGGARSRSSRRSTRASTPISLIITCSALEPLARGIMRRFYHRCEVVLAPAESTAADASRAADEPRHRDLGARHRPRTVQPRPPRHGVAARARHRRRRAGRRLPRPDRDGKGPRRLRRRDPRASTDARSSIACWSSAKGRRGHGSSNSCPTAIFLGQQTGADLARALASADVLLNPSVTEAFGNVTLEAMACGLPVVAAEATGATNLVRDGDDRNAGRWHATRRVRRRARSLCTRPRPSPPPRRSRPGGRQDHGLGHDQLGRAPDLHARHRQARSG